tara:strand:+ start:126541 stop:127071 length:531 start_codon:yes stop_codon:yes gene_type:complete
MTKFRIKSEQEMQKPFGKCIRLLEDLQFYRQRVVPTDDPKWFRRVHPDILCSTDGPMLEMTSGYLEGSVTNLGCIEFGLDDSYHGWFFNIEFENHIYFVPQQIVDIPDTCGTNYRDLARSYYEQVSQKNSRSKLWSDILIEVYEEEMTRNPNGLWEPILTSEVVLRFEQRKALLSI